MCFLRTQNDVFALNYAFFLNFLTYLFFNICNICCFYRFTINIFLSSHILFICLFFFTHTADDSWILTSLLFKKLISAVLIWYITFFVNYYFLFVKFNFSFLGQTLIFLNIRCHNASLRSLSSFIRSQFNLFVNFFLLQINDLLCIFCLCIFTVNLFMNSTLFHYFDLNLRRYLFFFPNFLWLRDKWCWSTKIMLINNFTNVLYVRL